MNDDNVETIRRWFAALERGDPAPDLCHPDIEVTDAFQEFHWELKSIEAVDDRRCLTVQRIVGRFRHTGIDLDFAWGSIVTVSDGKIPSAVGYATPKRAKRAARLDSAP